MKGKASLILCVAILFMFIILIILNFYLFHKINLIEQSIYGSDSLDENYYEKIWAEESRFYEKIHEIIDYYEKNIKNKKEVL